MKPFALLLTSGLLGAAALTAQAQAPAAAPAAATATTTATTTVAAPAQPPSALQIRVWASTCMACHGTAGRAQPGMPSLAGMPRDEMIRKMTDYRSGRTPATVMHHHARGYSDDQIAAIAGYFAALPR